MSPSPTLWISDDTNKEIEIYKGGYNVIVDEELDYYFNIKQLDPNEIEKMNFGSVNELEDYLKTLAP